MRWFTPSLSLLLALPAQAPEAALPVVEPGEVLYRGRPDALHRGLSPAGGSRAFELSPDGKSFLYLQGAPWPRVMLKRLASGPDGGGPQGSGPEPVALGRVAFHGSRPPRFDVNGRRVFFTADESAPPAARVGPPTASRALPPPAPGASGEPLRTSVVRADLKGSAAEKLLPAPGARREDYAVFLDVHPGGRTILVGTGPVERDAASPGYSLALSELTFRDDGSPIVPPRALSFQVGGQAPVRYSWDGTAVYYGQGPADGPPSPVFRYLRSSGIHEPVGLDQDRMGWLGGDVEVFARQAPHPGAIGWDGFMLHLLGRSPEGPLVPFRVPSSLLTPLPLVPVSVRGERILLAGGPQDRLEVAVARWDPGAFEAALNGSGNSAHPLAAGPALQRPPFSEEMLAGAADARAAGLLRKVRSSLVLLPGAPLRSIRARWTQRSLAPGGGLERQVEAIELASGALWIERTQRPPAEGQAEIREVIASDGREAWFVGEGGETAALGTSSFLAEAAAASPIRLLVDPVGTGLAGLTFSTSSSGGEERLEVRAVDGYRADVLLASSPTLPARIESPLLFPEDRVRRDMGEVPARKSVSFEDYRPEGGRLVPGRIRFEDGLNPFELVLLEVEINPPRAETVFKR